MIIGIIDKCKLKVYERFKEDFLKVRIDLLKELLLFSNKGNVYKVLVFLMKNIIVGEILLEYFLGKLEKNEKIISLFLINFYEEELGIYVFIKKGMVKKILLKDFEGDCFR